MCVKLNPDSVWVFAGGHRVLQLPRGSDHPAGAARLDGANWEKKKGTINILNDALDLKYDFF